MNDNTQERPEQQSKQNGYGQGSQEQQDQLNQDMQDRYNQGYSSQSQPNQQDQLKQDTQGQTINSDQPTEQNPSVNQERRGPLEGARQMAGNQIDQAIDQFAKKIPGGEQQKQRAKNAAEGILDRLEKQGEDLLGNLGGIFGKQKNKE